MAKYCGNIGFAQTSEQDGVWKEVLVPRKYTGDLVRNTRKLTGNDKVNNDITVRNSISIVADPYALNNFFSIRYAEFMGTKWKVTDVEVQYPRLILSLGEVYNGEPD